MTTESMTIHQALVELKTLEKRIRSAIQEGGFVTANKHSNAKINGIPVQEYAADVESRYQKITDLIRRREAIKCAVVISNAVTTVEVGDKTYTVAEAIEMKNHGLDNKSTLMTQLSMEYTAAKRMADRANNEELERRAEDHIKNMFGNTDMKGASEEVKRAREEFIKAQTMELVDPIGVRARVEELNEEITIFRTNVDAALSVSNALTTITIEY
jgi:hypothetical protein